MIRFAKKFVMSSLIFSSLFSTTYFTHAAPPQIHEFKVQINEQLLPFPDAQPFLDNNHFLQIPVRTLSQKLNYDLSWEHAEQSLKITLKNSDHTFTFTTGENTAAANGKAVILDSAPQLINGTAYVPLREFADAIDIRIQWDAKNRIAILNLDGNYHAPSWYAPNYRLIDGIATAYTGSSAENGGYEGIDYFGNPLTVGSVAVDPTFIPLGSKIYIEGYRYDGLPTHGLFATATDTGGSVKGNRIDIYVPDNKKKADEFGMQQVKIYILDH